MDDFREYITYGQSDRQFLLTFPDKSLLFCFTGLNFATNKLPKQASILMCRPLTYHEIVTVPYEGSYYFCYHFLTFRITQPQRSH